MQLLCYCTPSGGWYPSHAPTSSSQPTVSWYPQKFGPAVQICHPTCSQLLENDQATQSLVATSTTGSSTLRRLFYITDYSNDLRFLVVLRSAEIISKSVFCTMWPRGSSITPYGTHSTTLDFRAKHSLL